MYCCVFCVCATFRYYKWLSVPVQRDCLQTSRQSIAYLQNGLLCVECDIAQFLLSCACNYCSVPSASTAAVCAKEAENMYSQIEPAVQLSSEVWKTLLVVDKITLNFYATFCKMRCNPSDDISGLSLIFFAALHVSILFDTNKFTLTNCNQGWSYMSVSICRYKGQCVWNVNVKLFIS